LLHELATATGKRLMFYCAFGERSAMAALSSQDKGFSDACHIRGGMQAWNKIGGQLTQPE